MSLLAKLKGRGPNGFGYGSTADEVSEGVELNGKTILITGCNSGLGLETARVLAMRGAHVVGLARTQEKAREALSQFKGPTTSLGCELSDPNSVRACISALKASKISLDTIICNAGIMALSKLELDHGFESQFFTNHMGHFILVTGILDLLKPDGRVLVLSSSAHRRAPKGGIDFDNLKGEKDYSPWTAYGQSKIANLLFARELARRFQGTKKTAYAVHPGVISTNLKRHLSPIVATLIQTVEPLLLKSIPQGAATQVFLATHANPGAPSGAYFADCNPAPCRSDALDADLARKLWDYSEKIAAKL